VPQEPNIKLTKRDLAGVLSVTALVAIVTGGVLYYQFWVLDRYEDLGQVDAKIIKNLGVSGKGARYSAQVQLDNSIFATTEVRGNYPVNSYVCLNKKVDKKRELPIRYEEIKSGRC